MIDGFLIGLIVATSAVAGLFFLRFWRRTRDGLFLAFGIAFLIEAGNRVRYLFLDNPGDAAASIYMVRVLAYAIILAAVAHKNFSRAPR